MDAAATTGETAEPSYLQELWTHKLLLILGLIGLGVGYGSAPYVFSIMGPRLIAEFNWARSDFAAINSLILLVVILFPLMGRITDLIGVKRTALMGVIAMPTAYVAYSMIEGDMRVYMLIFLLQAAFGITTTAIVFTRLIVHYFKRARGLALAIVASGTAVFGLFAAPALNEYVELEGWRAGYLLIAAITAILGGLALFFLPTPNRAARPPLTEMSKTKEDYAEIFRNRAFWILAGAILLCNMPTVISLNQLMVLLQENGISAGAASAMLAAHATGTLIGRFACGAALDRWPMHIVSAIGMGFPAIGLALIALPYDAPALLIVAVLFIGVAVGAEGDLLGYVIAAKFGTRVYSSVLGFLSGVMGITSAFGALLLGFTLALTDTFDLFLVIAATFATAGALLLLSLKYVKPHIEEPSSAKPQSPPLPG
jgi:predicted MFS family arabinose efflux permease